MFACSAQVLKCMHLNCQSTEYHLYSEHFGILSIEELILNFYLSPGNNDREICYIKISLLFTLSDGENPF